MKRVKKKKKKEREGLKIHLMEEVIRVEAFLTPTHTSSASGAQCDFVLRLCVTAHVCVCVCVSHPASPTLPNLSWCR